MKKSIIWAALTLMSLALFVLAGAPGAQAAPVTITQGDFQFTLDNNEATLAAYIGSGGAVTIPSSVTHQGASYLVTAIGEAAFVGRPALTSVTIPSSVKRIQKEAFMYAGFSQISIPSSVTEIGESAFRMSMLTSITIPDSVTKLGEYALHGCESLKTAVVGSGITVLPAGTFYLCPVLEGVTLRGAVTEIGIYAFHRCAGLKGSFALPQTLKKLNHLAFSECTGISSISIPKGCADIADDAFEGCTQLELEVSGDDFRLPKALKSIAKIRVRAGATYICDRAFDAWYYLTDVYLPEGIASIGDYAFNDCYKLKNFNMPKSVTKIGKSAFSYCDALQTSLIPPSLVTLGDYAFYECTRLPGAVNLPASLQSIGTGAFAGCASIKSATIPASIKAVPNELFRSCTSLTSVSLPSGLTSIGSSAFEDAPLRPFDLPNSLQSIGDYAFSGAKITTLSAPASLRSVGQYAFENCYELTEANLPGATSIGDCAFQSCTKLLTIKIPQATTLGSGVLTNCEQLKSVELCVGLTQLPNAMFRDCGSLVTVSLPAGLTSIGGAAFESCRSMTSIALPSTLKALGRDAFIGCSALTTISLPPSLTSIVGGAFQQSGLTQISWPASVATIGNYTFSSCGKLTSVNIPNTVTSIHDGAFSACSSLKTLRVPASVTFIAVSAFEECLNLTLHVNAGSYAETFAKNNSIPFVLVDGSVTLTVEGPTSLTKGGTATYTARRSDAQSGSYTWSSSNTAVATIDQTGKLTAVGVGSATVTATADNGQSASCQVSVTDPGDPGGDPDAIVISSDMGDSALLFPKQKLQLSASVVGVSWKSSAPSYVSVSKAGLVTAIKAGKTATITASLGNASATFKVTVAKKPSAIKIASATAYTNGPAVQMKHTLSPKGAGCRAVTWSIEGDAASITSDGLLTAIRDGEVTVRATSDTGITARRVVPIRTLPTILALNATEASVKLKGKLQLYALMNGSEPSVTWRSSSKKIATVSKKGVIKAIKTGTATITATTPNGLTATCTVRVVKKLPAPASTSTPTSSPAPTTAPSPTPVPTPEPGAEPTLPAFDPEILP